MWPIVCFFEEKKICIYVCVCVCVYLYMCVWVIYIHPFWKGISLKMTMIVWLEFELTYYSIVVQHVNPYTTETPQKEFSISVCKTKHSIQIGLITLVCLLIHSQGNGIFSGTNNYFLYKYS